jgi:hypothetical protein
MAGKKIEKYFKKMLANTGGGGAKKKFHGLHALQNTNAHQNHHQTPKA